MSKSKKQLKKDLSILNTDDNKEINQIIEHTKKLGSSEYFVKSLYSSQMEKHQRNARFHDVEYLDITEFNYHHWISNKMEDY